MAKFSLSTDFLKTLSNWAIGLRNLSIENVKGYETDIEIPFGEEIKITHNLNLIPTRFIITDSWYGGMIVRGDTKATSQFFYLKNTGAGMGGSVDFKGKVLIMP